MVDTPDININVVPIGDTSKIESTVNKPLAKSVSTYEKSINNSTTEALNKVSSTFSESNFKGPETSLLKRIVTNFVAGATLVR